MTRLLKLGRLFCVYLGIVNLCPYISNSTLVESKRGKLRLPNKNPAPLLPDATVIQIKEIARDVRKGIVAPLIGSGISHTRDIPLWAELIEM